VSKSQAALARSSVTPNGSAAAEGIAAIELLEQRGEPSLQTLRGRPSRWRNATTREPMAETSSWAAVDGARPA
jgi:hypothetical protein